MKLLILLHNKRVGLLIDIAEKFFLFIIKKQHTPYIIALNIIIIIQIISLFSSDIYYLFLNKL
jgi:hypothetical protein